MMVDRISSGTNRALSAIIEGQKMPTQASNRQKAKSWNLPFSVMPPLLLSPRLEPAPGGENWEEGGERG